MTEALPGVSYEGPPRHASGSRGRRGERDVPAGRRDSGDGVDRRGRRDRRQKRSRRPLVVAVVAVLLVVGALGAWTVVNDGYLFGIRTPLAAPDYEGAGGEAVVVEVPQAQRVHDRRRARGEGRGRQRRGVRAGVQGEPGRRVDPARHPRDEAADERGVGSGAAGAEQRGPGRPDRRRGQYGRADRADDDRDGLARGGRPGGGCGPGGAGPAGRRRGRAGGLAGRQHLRGQAGQHERGGRAEADGRPDRAGADRR